MNTTKYYVAVNGSSQGPYTVDQLAAMQLKPTTLVWRSGMSEWTKLAAMPELSHLLQPQCPPAPEVSAAPVYEQVIDIQGPEYFMMQGLHRLGPFTLEQLVAKGVSMTTPVWTEGMADWAPASTRPEIVDALNRSNAPAPRPADNGDQYGLNNPGYKTPDYGQYTGQQYGQQGAPNGYNRPDYPQYGVPGGNVQPYTNWLPWAIAGTIVGALFSCIGLIFGVIGIVQANKANTAHQMGDDATAQTANSSAKTMTIIALVLGGIGLIATCGLFWTGFTGSIF